MASKTETLYFASPVWLQNVMVSAVGYKLYRKRYTGIYHELRELVRASREWGAEQREAYQAEQLHELIRYCRLSIPYYQKLFAEYGLGEQDFTQVSDLAKLPILDKQTIRERGDEFRAPHGKPFMIQHTSGSTGTPLALHVNERTYKLAMALLVDHEEYHGVPFGARRATFAGRMIQKPENLTPPYARFNRAENQRLYSSYHLNDQTFEHYRRDLNRFQPLEIIGYPSAISDIANHYEQAGCKPAFEPTAIITNSETLLEWQRDTIERVFKCPIFDYYGTAEYLTYSAQDSIERYRSSPIIGISEVLDNSPSQNFGRIIATSLTNYCMPLIRYDLRDTAEPDYRTCNDNPAGNVKYYLKRISGRIDDYITTPDGRLLGRLDHIFKGTTGIREGQIIQDSSDHCLIRVSLDLKADQFNEKKLISNFRERVGDNINITVEVLSEIPRGSNGKFRSVISNKTYSKK